MKPDNVVELRSGQGYIRTTDEPPSGGDHGGPTDPMDPWQTSVETRLGQLHSSIDRLGDRVDSNFKWLLGAYGVGFVTLAGMMVAGYLMLADKIDMLAR